MKLLKKLKLRKSNIKAYFAISFRYDFIVHQCIPKAFNDPSKNLPTLTSPPLSSLHLTYSF